MRRAGTWLAVAVLTLTACGGADDETAVLGISVERDPTPSATATSSPDAEEPSPAQEPSPAATPSVEASSEPAPPPPPPPPPVVPSPEPSAQPSPEPPPPPPPPPSPSPSPTPEPFVLGDADSGGFSRWDPHTEPPDECCWIELDGSRPVTRDGDPADHAVRGSLVDPVAAEAGQPEPWQRPQRQATCQGWLQAPADRGMVARGTAFVEVTFGDGMLTSGSYPVDVDLAAGARHDLPRPSAGTADAYAGEAVTCTVRFVAS